VVEVAVQIRIRQLLALLVPLLALLAAPALADQVAVTVDASPREGGTVSAYSAVTSGAFPSLPYTFTAPAGTQITFAAQPAPGYKLWYWLVNGTKYAGSTLSVTAQGRNLTVVAVFGPNATVMMAETEVATLYVTSTGQVWVQPKPLQLQVPALDQTVTAQLYYSVQWVNQTYTDAFGFTRSRLVPQASFRLRLENRCGRTCEPAAFYVYHPNGTPAFAATLRGNSTEVPWGNRTALILVYMAGRWWGPYVPVAVEAAYPVPQDVAPYLPLLPLGLFVALAVRSNARDAALGLAAYVAFAAAIWGAFGAGAYLPVTVVGFTVAAVLLAVDVFSRR
jgi:hypothetical protein